MLSEEERAEQDMREGSCSGRGRWQALNLNEPETSRKKSTQF